MFAYCGNNPVSRVDIGGYFWDTVFDVASLVLSVVEVVNNPDDVGAWVGLVCDVVDVAIPFVGGLGETARAVNAVMEVADTVDDIHDASKVADNVMDGIDDMSDAYKAASGGLCFVEGTLVHIQEGYIEIENIDVGQFVWAWDESTNSIALKEVVETYVNKTDELVHVFVNGEEIVTTPNHPFYSPVKGWTEAVRLRAGDILVLVNGEYVVVEKVQHEILEAPIIVYNFQVQDYHTYYVSTSGILVHNDCIHGNSLNSTKTNYGYQLQDSQGNILKYGETINPSSRYSQKWLADNEYTMYVMVSGSKEYVHQWQHQKILDYAYIAGHRPPLNKSFW